MVSKLDNLADWHNQQSDYHMSEARRISLLADQHSEESSRARKIVSNLNKLLEV
jgi:hypothetical protein